MKLSNISTLAPALALLGAVVSIRIDVFSCDADADAKKDYKVLCDTEGTKGAKCQIDPSDNEMRSWNGSDVIPPDKCDAKGNGMNAIVKMTGLQKDDTVFITLHKFNDDESLNSISACNVTVFGNCPYPLIVWWLGEGYQGMNSTNGSLSIENNTEVSIDCLETSTTGIVEE